MHNSRTTEDEYSPVFKLLPQTRCATFHPSVFPLSTVSPHYFILLHVNPSISLRRLHSAGSIG